MADDGIAFDGTTPERAAPGRRRGGVPGARRGASPRAAIACACAIAAPRRSRTTASTGRRSPPACPTRADLYIANRGHRLIGLVPRARGRRVLDSQSRPLSARSRAMCWRAAAPPAGDRHHRRAIMQRRCRGGCRAAAAPSFPMAWPTPFRAPRRAACAAAAARDLHLEPAARPRLAARSVGAAHPSGACPRPSCISIAGPRSMARSATRKAAAMARGAGARRRAGGEGRAPPRAAAARAS